mmetsp:Transcript_117889/g.279767  ORF Transcript_117889/g.279767 Transcript_117889/m.279767 type:complete len:279 (-) Transcript_117889:1095-1931(-)
MKAEEQLFNKVFRQVQRLASFHQVVKRDACVCFLLEDLRPYRGQVLKLLVDGFEEQRHRLAAVEIQILQPDDIAAIRAYALPQVSQASSVSKTSHRRAELVEVQLPSALGVNAKAPGSDQRPVLSAAKVCEAFHPLRLLLGRHVDFAALRELRGLRGLPASSDLEEKALVRPLLQRHIQQRARSSFLLWLAKHSKVVPHEGLVGLHVKVLEAQEVPFSCWPHDFKEHAGIFHVPNLSAGLYKLFLVYMSFTVYIHTFHPCSKHVAVLLLKTPVHLRPE